MGSLFGTPPFETATSLLNPNSKPDSHAWPTPSPPWTAAADVIVAFVCHGPSLYLRTPSTGSWLRTGNRFETSQYMYTARRLSMTTLR